ncbi:MAG: PQQ-binding-like beta-propeller repeat protein, partial [Pseudomonadales bacterium]|nr:PQQ-binding-like beta-propeller repeat protein [Pseudomonadales bacterium]
LQLRDDGGNIHLLRKLPEATYREVTSQVDWATYNGNVSGNRYTEMTQIDKSNVRRLAPLWSFPLSNALIENTPLVVEGVMYVTAANEVWALDAGTGRELWHYRQPRTAGVSGMAATGANRGVAVQNGKVFLQTDHAHMIALDQADGALLWDTEMADWRQEYAGISAPLIVDNVVIGGVAAAARGFIAGYDADTGAEVWRRWTVPMAGEAGSETWIGDAISEGAGTTWATGTYDPELDILYWGTGNPRPAYDGSRRLGDNLYTDSVLALNPHTGDLYWYFQFTPHDTHDWDAHEPLVLVDTLWRGEPRKLLLQANRNGFFYVLDRTNGEFLLAKPFLKNLNWASGVGDDGRPILKELPVIATGENFVCPSYQGGANWFSTSFNPATGLYYFQALERCGLFSTVNGGSSRQVPGEEGFQKYVIAMNIQTGEPAFEIAQGPAPATASAGLLTTASGLLIFGENSGSFIAADAATGEVLWQYQANVTWKASPMTYMFDGKQYIGVATGTSITAFGIVE